MKLFGSCEKCEALLEEGKAILTQPSKLFKGTNRYLICNECGAVSLYNESLGSIFNIDKFKDNQNVINEISELLEKLNMEIIDTTEEIIESIEEEDILYNNEEVPKEHELANCSGSCATCPGCSGHHEEHHECECGGECNGECNGNCSCKDEEECDFEYDRYIFAYNKASGDVSLLAKEDISILGDINKYDFFVLEPVKVKPVTTYEIIKK
jgi:hypothetical protein